MSVERGWIVEKHIWFIEYAGVITTADFIESAQTTLDVLAHHQYVTLLFDLSEVMLASKPAHTQNKFKLFDIIWTHTSVKHIIFLVPGGQHNVVGQLIHNRCAYLGILPNVTFCNDETEVRRAIRDLLPGTPFSEAS